jgi:hypothetical protein
LNAWVEQGIFQPNPVNHVSNTLRLDHMTSENQCQVKDDLVNQLMALNNKLNTLSPALLHSEQEREEVQQQRENLYLAIKRHRAKGHQGKPCPAVQRFPFR